MAKARGMMHHQSLNSWDLRSATTRKRRGWEAWRRLRLVFAFGGAVLSGGGLSGAVLSGGMIGSSSPAWAQGHAAAAPSAEEGEWAAFAQKVLTRGASATTPGASGEEAEGLFPAGPVLAAKRGFWLQIFTRYGVREGVLHHARSTLPVYSALDLQGLSRRQARRRIAQERQTLKASMLRLAKALEKGHSPRAEDAALLSLERAPQTAAGWRQAAENVRFQRGLRQRFREGIVRSGAYLGPVRAILQEAGVPLDLAYLPHVESSYNYRAYSKLGAAGIWQFTRSTGKQFMRVDYAIDERIDPIIATGAAARFLMQNYRRLGSWPLAITAYNHGPNSLNRIINELGTRDLEQIVQRYHRRQFRFASKNFYAEFLAAREAAQHAEHYFGPLQPAMQLAYQEVELPFYLDFEAVTGQLDLDARRLARLNPALRPTVLRGDKRIPKGYRLRLPDEVSPRAFLASLPADLRYERQKRTRHVLVRRGDTLYDIGLRHRVSWERIARANHISTHHRIRPGQRLIIPADGEVLPPLEVRRVDPATVSADEPTTPTAKDPTGKGPTAKGSPALVAGLPQTPRPKSAWTPFAASRLRDARLDDARLADSPREEKPSWSEAEPTPLTLAHQPAEGRALFPDLELRYHRQERQAHIHVTYGETLGHYATWARVPTAALRRANRMAYRATLKPGSLVRVPLAPAAVDDFIQHRVEYHQGREQDFFDNYVVTGKMPVVIGRGDSIWRLTRRWNVPTWLFYQSNVDLLGVPLKPGMTIAIPRIEARTEEPPLEAQQSEDNEDDTL